WERQHATCEDPPLASQRVHPSCGFAAIADTRIANAFYESVCPHLDSPLFRSRKKGPGGEPKAITVRQAERVVKEAARAAGLKNASEVSPHWLRHAHASHAMDRGAKIHLVQATLGHASVSTTGRYLHARPDESSALYLGS
ncbi:MAG: tyrosine-type recombinase/integrase, partial [Actinomycetota bacterium]|nr:tyrosine-type recombinase/integrase [Actinomycetota bacterium]